ncbi:MAG: BREX-1 system phosphatase PglZ type A, partial [Spirochaetales bacterium]|nr:BREX-1 system phosphatase PglZ type A [Spirochaetales bacterium]
MDKQSLDTLQKLFMRHRLVFWYDDKGTLREEYEGLSLEGVTKLEIVNNEFALKYHVLREEPDRKFLLYQASPQPPDDENWLLDLLLSSGEFRTDRTAILLSELDMDISFQHVIKKHAAFFDSKARIQQLKKLSSKNDSSRDLQTKLLAVCCGNDGGRLDESLMALLAEGIVGGEDRLNLVARCNLTEHLWEEIKIRYGYVSGNPSLFDFAFEVFQFSFERSIGLFDEENKLSIQASLFLKQWKDSKTYSDSFVAYSKKLGDELNIPSRLQALDFKAVIDCDLFEAIDTYCIIALLEQVKGR